MQPVPTGYPIAELSGPFIVGALLNWGLFGTLSVQLYLYYLAFPNDRRFTKYLVYGIYVIEFRQTMLVAHDTFVAFGSGFGDIGALTGTNFNWLTGPIIGAVAACVGQVFYAYRIFIVSKSRIIPIFIICISLTSSSAGIITGIYSCQAGNVIILDNRRVSIAIGIWCGASALCDVLIAVFMTYYLMHSTTNLRSTRILVAKIIRLIIETRSVTAVVALLTLILFVAFPHPILFITPGMLVPKLYANAVYMVLNSRFQIVDGRDTYNSATDITTTMIRDITSRLAEDTLPMDGMQGRTQVVAISHEESNDTHETDQTSNKLEDNCMILSV
ncbi:hypothetical protein IW261DRAFT_1605016 [Armillaria novae-zelandiae]|uniref:DUF6534 domain-containing protein n=1 Tax=Armillaria novae-zelandiae TaxID=153914 RepID=A0AA39PKD3_9AGAR|nr:hypothetical protein IW261DRAFT_1605016 [Armillaria novae-zelandiae]